MSDENTLENTLEVPRPLHSEPRSERRVAPWKWSDTSSETTRILLVEDDDEMREMLKEALEDSGYDVEVASDGQRFLGVMLGALLGKRSVPDLIVSDIRMPHLSGLEVLEEIRHVDWSTPVILITAFGDAPTHAEAERLGAAEVIDKPFELDDLVQRVITHLPPHF